ncbi:MAG: hypothetical protein R2849_15640 [Thermomicrobiales bacterium]
MILTATGRSSICTRTSRPFMRCSGHRVTMISSISLLDDGPQVGGHAVEHRRAVDMLEFPGRSPGARCRPRRVHTRRGRTPELVEDECSGSDRRDDKQTVRATYCSRANRRRGPCEEMRQRCPGYGEEPGDHGDAARIDRDRDR